MGHGIAWVVICFANRKSDGFDFYMLNQTSDSQITLYKELAFKELLFTEVLIIGDDANS